MLNGFDYFQLEQEVARLEKARYRFVRILRNGVRGLSQQPSQAPLIKPLYQMSSVDAELVVTASLKQVEDYWYINLGKSTSTYEALGLQSVERPYENTSIYLEQLSQFVKKALASGTFKRVVFVHEDNNVYQNLMKSDLAVFKDPNVWYLNSGNSSLVSYWKKIRQTQRAQSQMKKACLK